MPIPGGVLALQQSLSFYPAVQRPQRRSSSFVPGISSPSDDPEVLAYNETSRYFKDNLKCSMMFFKEVIPSTLDTVHGVLIVETKREIVHSGMFILLKGLTLPPKKRHVRRMEGNGKRQVTSLKYVVMGYTASGRDGEGDIVIEEGSRESYPLELKLPSSPDELPTPMITGEGKLMYRLQLFMTTSEGRHVQVGETKLQFQGSYNLNENEEVEKPWRLPLQVQSKRSILALGRKKTVNLEVGLESSGYLPQESMAITVAAQTQDKATQVECKVELVQKVWYQVPVPGGRKMSVKMKINVVATTPPIRFEVEQGKDVVLQDTIRVPKALTPTCKYDFMNSISYILKVTAGVVGEKDGRVVGEASLIIGTSRDTRHEVEGNDSPAKEEEDGAIGGSGWSCDTSPCRSGAVTPQMRASQSLTFIPFRERSNSQVSVNSQTSSTLSILRMPPSYSQLSSRRPTLETLPPAYCELELQEKSTLLQHEEESEQDKQKL